MFIDSIYIYVCMLTSTELGTDARYIDCTQCNMYCKIHLLYISDVRV